jgi:hypothetical protein
MRENDKEYLRKKLRCKHSKNSLFCPKCRYDPKPFLKYWENINTAKL